MTYNFCCRLVLATLLTRCHLSEFLSGCFETKLFEGSGVLRMFESLWRQQSIKNGSFTHQICKI